MRFALGIFLLVGMMYGFAACVPPSEVKPTLPPVAVSPTPAPKPVDKPAQNAGAPVKLPGLDMMTSQYLLGAIEKEMPNLEKASGDMKRFCPKYNSLDFEQRVVVWGHLTSAIIKFESDYNKCSDMMESNGELSIGYFQLSYGNTFCPKNKAQGNLCSPTVNIDCGIKILGMYVKRDGVVTGGGYTAYGAPSPKGAACYWSVARVPDPKPHLNSKGKWVQPKHNLAEIQALAAKAPGCK